MGTNATDGTDEATAPLHEAAAPLVVRAEGR